MGPVLVITVGPNGVVIPSCIHDGFVYFDDLRYLSTEYLYYVFCGATMFEGLGKLGTQLNLNTDTIGGICVPVPPSAAQAAIVARLDHETELTDSAVNRIERQIELLSERRQSLITAAVTGQIDIPGVAA